MTNNYFPKYFLGANASGGFVSEFEKCYSAQLGWTAYIIKGGPGTGKSSLMKKVAGWAYDRNQKCIICPCSSDPESLDAVILPESKTVFLDGTPPHTVEPQFPAVCEQIVSTADFWDETKLDGKRERLLNLFALNKAYHKKASQYITAASQIAKYNFSAELACTDIEKAFKFGVNLARHTITPASKKSKEWVRFLSGITPIGYVFYGDTISQECKKQIVISDKYGAVSSIILSAIRDTALQNGREIITVKNPVLPDEITDHILIPELSLAFTTENEFMPSLSDSRRIHARRFVNMTELNASRQKLNFNRKVIKELLNSASEQLSTAKALHDQIEKYYIEIMDFDGLNKYTEKIIEKL